MGGRDVAPLAPREAIVLPRLLPILVLTFVLHALSWGWASVQTTGWSLGYPLHSPPP